MVNRENSLQGRAHGPRRARRRRARLFPLALSLALAVVAAGCGLQTEQANSYISQASKNQEEAEAVLARVKNFSAEWEAIFNVPKITATQVNAASQLLQGREQDLNALEASFKKWARDLRRVLALNVEEKVKEYVRLKLKSVKCYAEYVTGYLRPIVKAYSGLLDQIATGRPIAEVNKVATEITALVTGSVTKLAECLSAEKQADDYFTKNKVGQLAK